MEFYSKGRDELDRIEINSWSINHKGIEEKRPYYAGPYDFEELKYFYDNELLELDFAHLHKYFYH